MIRVANIETGPEKADRIPNKIFVAESLWLLLFTSTGAAVESARKRGLYDTVAEMPVFSAVDPVQADSRGWEKMSYTDNTSRSSDLYESYLWFGLRILLTSGFFWQAKLCM
jgi:hypothetical protein